MEFSPFHPIVKLCLSGMALAEQGKMQEALTVFAEMHEQAKPGWERFLALYFLGENNNETIQKLKYYTYALEELQRKYDIALKSTLPVLYQKLRATSRAAGNEENARFYDDLLQQCNVEPDDPGPFFHGTKALLQPGDQLLPGFESNYREQLTMNHIYFTALPAGAALAATLAKGKGENKVYRVKPVGVFEHDPNVTNKKFPGNLTRSYRTAFPLTVLEDIQPEPPQHDELQQWRQKMDGHDGEIIN